MFCDAAAALVGEGRAIGVLPSFFLLKNVPLLFLTWINSFVTCDSCYYNRFTASLQCVFTLLSKSEKELTGNFLI